MSWICCLGDEQGGADGRIKRFSRLALTSCGMDNRLPEPLRLRTVALGLLGAVIGGAVGYFAFFWIARQGLYALILPPALLGFTAGVCARRRSTPLALVCGLAGLALGLFVEWRFAPFVADSSLLYFMTHIHTLKPITMLMLALGAFLSYRLALGRDSNSKSTAADTR